MAREGFLISNFPFTLVIYLKYRIIGAGVLFVGGKAFMGEGCEMAREKMTTEKIAKCLLLGKVAEEKVKRYLDLSDEALVAIKKTFTEDEKNRQMTIFDRAWYKGFAEGFEKEREQARLEVRENILASHDFTETEKENLLQELGLDD